MSLPATHVVVPRRACLPGYVCLVSRRHVVEFHDLTSAEASAFTADLLRVSAAVRPLRRAVKINLASLGNLVPHLHVHVCPRIPGDRFEGRPLDPGDGRDDVYADAEHETYVAALRLALVPSCPQ
ncbi:MAG: hypothetical protein AMXMBFR22_31380 [Phycisphaerae bacterium]